MIQQAKELLKNKNLTSVLITPGETKMSNSTGIKHLLSWYNENPNVFRGGSTADTVVGLAAASILVFGGIKEVYGEVMSQSAVQLLENQGVSFSYGKVVESIMNRNGTDICPMEKICRDESSLEQAFNALRLKICGI